MRSPVRIKVKVPSLAVSCVNGVASIYVSLALGPHSRAITVNGTFGAGQPGSNSCLTSMPFPNVANAKSMV